MSITAFERQPIEKQKRIIHTGIKAFSAKAYQDVSTDSITRACGISKGLLFHYFGSKKEFYLYCLDKSLRTLLEHQSISYKGNFYDALFGLLEQRILLYKAHPLEVGFINMVSRENANEVAEEIKQALGDYKKIVRVQSMFLIRNAVLYLQLKNPEKQKVMEGLLLYVEAVLAKYLETYRENPDAFSSHAEMIKIEMKEYLDLILFGVCREKS